jgi:hypothetical protein
MVKETIAQREARNIVECLRQETSERDRMYEKVRLGKVCGNIDENGDVTVFTGGISSVKYSRDGGRVTYDF